MSLDTEQVINNAIEDAGLTADSGDESVETPDVEASSVEVDESTPEETPEPVAGDGTPDAQAVAPDAEQDELALLGKKGKNNRIPYHRVEKIVANKVAKAQEEARQAALAEAQQRYAQYESPEFANVIRTVQELERQLGNPEQFLNTLSQDPRFAQLLRREAQAGAQAQNFAPDVQLPDGSLGYSEDAFQRLLDARDAAIERKIAERYRPIQDSFEQAQYRNAALGKVNAQIADAQTWPGFNENREAIGAALNADVKLTLEGAYRKVVFGKLSASRDDIRKEILAEINAKPKAVQPKPSAGAAPVSSNKGRDTEDIIRQAIAGLGDK